MFVTAKAALLGHVLFKCLRWALLEVTFGPRTIDHRTGVVSGILVVYPQLRRTQIGKIKVAHRTYVLIAYSDASLYVTR